MSLYSSRDWICRHVWKTETDGDRETTEWLAHLDTSILTLKFLYWLHNTVFSLGFKSLPLLFPGQRPRRDVAPPWLNESILAARSRLTITAMDREYTIPWHLRISSAPTHRCLAVYTAVSSNHFVYTARISSSVKGQYNTHLSFALLAGTVEYTEWSFVER